MMRIMTSALGDFLQRFWENQLSSQQYTSDFGCVKNWMFDTSSEDCSKVVVFSYSFFRCCDQLHL